MKTIEKKRHEIVRNDWNKLSCVDGPIEWGNNIGSSIIVQHILHLNPDQT